MPKQVWKIERFDGGLNTNADPRDIDDKELAAATDIIVDNVGKIRTMGGTATHGTVQAFTAAIEAGYGLFQFSHDRTGANVMSADYSGTHTAADHGTIMTDSAATFPANALIGATINNTTDGSSGTITDNAGTTVTATLSGGSDDSWDTSDAYTITAFPETGDDYLVIADADSASNIDIYSKNSDMRGYGNIDLGSTTGMKTVFYQADGALRVSDSNFGVANQNKWYGYIKQTHFAADSDGDAIAPGGSPDAYDGWYSKSLNLAKPTGGVFGPAVAFTDTTASSGATTTDIEYGGGATDIFQHWANFDGEEYIAVVSGQNARVITKVQDTGGGNNDDLVTVANAGNWTGEAIELYPPIGKGFNVYFDNSSDTGSWTGGTYEIGTTFIYQGGQESNVFDISAGGNRSINDDNILNTGSALDVKIFATSPYDPFITGGRVYIRKYGSDTPWVLLVDISLKDGVRKDLTTSYSAWTLRTATGSGDAPSSVYLTVDLGAIVDPSPWTYEKINGYQADESIDIGAVGEGFKTAVVANRQTYIGNVRREGKDGVTRTEGDAMYKSMPGKFDTFPLARKIEASVQDGDQIVKLEEYADRILQFKKTKMHLINISQDVEFLEDTFMNKGISHPASTCKTDFGIAWANAEGCYLYDGKNVINLLEKQGRQIIKEEEWAKFLTADKDGTSTGLTPMVGYLPKKRQIIVFDDITTGSTADPRMYLYDMVTQSWVQGADDSSTRIIDIVKTNFVTDWNGDLIYAHTSGTVVKWDDTSDATDTISFKTKDIDFGHPAVRKKVYKAYISYKGDGSAVTIAYQTNGDTDAGSPFYRTESDGSSDKTNSDTTPLLNVGTDDWVLAELKPVTSIKNIYSFQLIFDGTAAADFEINDISIVYRMKTIR